MPKITMRALDEPRPGATYSDPAVEGLRYRVRASGKVFAEWMYKRDDGRWVAVALAKEFPKLGHVNIHERIEDLIGVEEWDWRDPDRPPGRGIVTSLDEVLAPWREAARELRRKIRAGHDPRSPVSPDSLKALIDRYLENVVPSLRPRTQAESKRHLTKHWAPLHDRPAAALTKREIAEHLLKLKAENGPVAALRSRATLRAMFAWAFDADLIPAMPPFPSKKTLAVKERSRERVLSLNELREIWAAAGDGDHGVIVRLLMLTGQRRQEVGGLKWSELDLDRALWSLPPERTKSGEAHTVPLSRQAVELLRGVERRPGRDHLFGDGRGSYSGWSRSKRRLDGRAKVAEWRLHDLRRSLQSHLHELGVSSDVTERILNHARQGVQKVYDRATYLPARTQALQRWADTLLQSEA
jgi:integrase